MWTAENAIEFKNHPAMPDLFDFGSPDGLASAARVLNGLDAAGPCGWFAELLRAMVTPGREPRIVFGEQHCGGCSCGGNWPPEPHRN